MTPEEATENERARCLSHVNDAIGVWVQMSLDIGEHNLHRVAISLDSVIESIKMLRENILDDESPDCNGGCQ